MTADAVVHEVLDALAVVGAEPKVAGGWGIDALVGEQTRPHRDLDLAVRADVLEAALAALRQRGFRVTTDWLPIRVELSRNGDRVDLHPLHESPDGVVWQAGFGGSRFEYPANGWTTGHIGGREVVCLGPALQKRFHSGYRHGDVDLHDLALLDRYERRG